MKPKTKKVLISSTTLVVTAVLLIAYVTVRNAPQSAKFSLDITAIRNTLSDAQLPYRLVPNACQNPGSDFHEWQQENKAINKQQPFNFQTLVDKIRVAKHEPSPEDPRVTCIIFTRTAAETTHAVNGWLKECNEFKAVLTANSTFGNIVPADATINLPNTPAAQTWQRLRGTIRALFADRVDKQRRNLPVSDYYAFSEDDSLVIVNNLRFLFKEQEVQFLHKAKAPLLMGHRMVQTGTSLAFVSTGMFVMNDVVLRILAGAFNHAMCQHDNMAGGDDILLATCLRSFKIFPLDSVDVFGEDRIHIFEPHTLIGVNTGPASWYNEYRRSPMPTGADTLSRYTISFRSMAASIADDFMGKLKRE